MYLVVRSLFFFALQYALMRRSADLSFWTNYDFLEKFCQLFIIFNLYSEIFFSLLELFVWSEKKIQYTILLYCKILFKSQHTFDYFFCCFENFKWSHMVKLDQKSWFLTEKAMSIPRDFDSTFQLPQIVSVFMKTENASH